jgi:hypothetical protein
MHSQVKDNGDPRDGGQANQLSVAEKSGGTVVVAVEEGQGLLLEEQEDGVEQLQVLGQVVELEKHPLLVHTATFRFSTYFTHVVENNQRLSPATIVVADGKEDTLADNSGQKLLNEESQEEAADGGQVEVVDEEERLELEGLAVAHQLSAAKDNEVVDDDEDGRRLQGGHGSLKRHELEVIGRVANDGREQLVKDGP